jgi:hypothetical protein
VKKEALVMGINNYPGWWNDLKGCVPDARAWGAILEGFGFNVKLLLDAAATAVAVSDWLNWVAATGAVGDQFVCVYSGHGTTVADTSGDESDQLDEAWYMYDGTLSDDELYLLLVRMPLGCNVTIISDSCHAGTMTRALDAPSLAPRYVHTTHIPSDTKVRRFRDLPEEGMCELLLAGCAPDEYGYEGTFDGEAHGVFSHHAQAALRALGAGTTYEEWYASIREALPSEEFPQTPQLEGRAESKALPVFGGSGEVPDPEPGPDEPGCLSAVMAAIVRLVWHSTTGDRR